jgi:hypothetical protein
MGGAMPPSRDRRFTTQMLAADGGYRMDIAAEFMAAIINAFDANKRLRIGPLNKCRTTSSTPPSTRTRTPLSLL